MKKSPYSFKQYQKESKKTAKYPDIGHRVIYPSLGLGSESGEVLDKIKKIFRDKNGQFTKDDIEQITKELGDVMWYTSQIATDLNIDLEMVAKKNIEKLYTRMKKGTLSGSGDDR